MAKTSEALRRAKAKYQANNCKVFTLNLTYSSDSDLIEFLGSLENKQGYIKALIREDMEKLGNGRR